MGEARELLGRDDDVPAVEDRLAAVERLVAQAGFY
jgi:hypothetical protein